MPDAAELGIDIRSVAGQSHAQVMQCLAAAQALFTDLIDDWCGVDA